MVKTVSAAVPKKDKGAETASQVSANMRSGTTQRIKKLPLVKKNASGTVKKVTSADKAASTKKTSTAITLIKNSGKKVEKTSSSKTGFMYGFGVPKDEDLSKIKSYNIETIAPLPVPSNIKPTGVLFPDKPQLTTVTGSNSKAKTASGKQETRPLKHDWLFYLTPAKNQRKMGACTAFAFTSAVEAYFMIENNCPLFITLDLSPASLFYPFVSNYKNGMTVSEALGVLRKRGICYEKDYPYKDSESAAKKPKFIEDAKRVFHISGYGTISNTEEMKTWLYKEGPLVAVFKVYKDFGDHFTKKDAKGVYRKSGSSKNKFLEKHAVLVIGYDDEQSCWICRNSWGTSAGNKRGLFRIGYGECEIDDYMVKIRGIYCKPSYIKTINYDKKDLKITDMGKDGWALMHKSDVWQMLDNKNDAEDALTIAAMNDTYCVIGADNKRISKNKYILKFFKGNGFMHRFVNEKVLHNFDIDRYDRTTLAVIGGGAGKEGPLLRAMWEGEALDLSYADNFKDAVAMLLELKQGLAGLGYIGRNNKRPERDKYILTYIA